jgi:hypothetical protein
VRSGLALGLPEDSEARAGDGAERVLALARLELVLAVAEKREVVVGEPLEQSLGLVEVLGVDGRRTRLELGDDLAAPLAHRRPVLDRRRDIRQGTLQISGELVEQRLLRVAVDLDVDQRLGDSLARVGRPWQQLEQAAFVVAPHADDGVHVEVDRAAVPGDRHRDRVDEEGHVVADDLDDAVRRLPAVLVDARRVGAHLRLAGAPALDEVPVRERGAVQVEVGEVLGRGVRVVLADELHDRRRLRLRQSRLDDGDRLLDEARLHFPWLDSHPAPLPLR